MLARIQIRRDNQVNWNSNNPILFAGEIGFETTTNKFKIGDGVSNWNSLDYQLGQWSVDAVNQELHYNDLDVAIDKNLSIGESLEIAKNLTVHGDFLVKGKTTTINNKNVTFNDSVLTLNWSEEPITPYQSELISGIEINVGLDDTLTLMESGLVQSVTYNSNDDETVITLSQDLTTQWPQPYYQNKVLYYSDIDDPTLNSVFFIKSYNDQNFELKVMGNASSIPTGKHVHIHNSKKQIVWGNVPFFEGWYIDDNLHVNGTITSDGNASWERVSNSTDIFYDLGNVGIGNSSPVEKLDVNGAIKIGDTSQSTEGSIKYENGDFKGYDGTQWKSLTYGGGSVSYNDLTDKPTIPSVLTDLSIVDGNNGQFLKTDGNGNFSFSDFSSSDSLDDILTIGNSTDKDIITTGKVYFSNMFPTVGDLPNPSLYHGMFAHVHATEKAYFAHAGDWVELANSSDIISSSYTNSNVDEHLNQTNPTDGYVLSWTSGDYAWVAQSGGGTQYADSDVNTLLNKDASSDGKVLSWNENSNSYTWVDQPTVGTPYADSDVNTLLNVSPNSPTAGHVLSWNGSDYAWVAQSGGNTSVSISDTEPTEKNSGDLWWNSNSGVLRIYYTDEDNHSYWVDIPSSTGGTSSSGGTLSNISDATFGVDVTGKVQAYGIDLGDQGIKASEGSVLDFAGTTINFQSVTIQNDNVFTGIINNHLWSGSTKPTDGYVLSWNQTLHAGDGDYEWVAQSSGGSGSSYITDNNSEVDVSTNLNVDGIITIKGAEEKFTTNSNSVGGTSTIYNYIHIMTNNNYTLLVGDHLHVVNTNPTVVRKYLGKVISFEIVTYNYIDYYKVKLGEPDDGVVDGTAIYIDNIETYNFDNESLSSSVYRANTEWFVAYGNSYDWNTLSLPDNTPAAYQEVIDVSPTILDCSSSYVHMIDGTVQSNFVINLTNLNLEVSNVSVITLFVQQGADAYIPNTLQLSGVEQTIKWQGNSPPTPTSNGVDVFSFTILRNASDYTILGQGIPFGG